MLIVADSYKIRNCENLGWVDNHFTRQYNPEDNSEQNLGSHDGEYEENNLLEHCAVYSYIS
jgi:hypothetical protein